MVQLLDSAHDRHVLKVYRVCVHKSQAPKWCYPCHNQWLDQHLRVMGKINYDNGGKFANEELLQVQSMLNIEPSPTRSESVYQNGICKRNHEVVDLILTKLVKEYPQTPKKVLLKWASTSKNSLQMVEGFSPHQLNFGRNPHLPNSWTPLRHLLKWKRYQNASTNI